MEEEEEDDRVEFVRVDHILLAAPTGTEEKARHFYGTICGMKEIPKPANLQKRGGVWFRVGSNQLHVGMEDPGTFHPNKKAHPAVEVRNLAGLRRRLVSNGVPVEDDEPLEGADRFYSEDPSGNRLEFIEWKEKRR